MPDIALLVPCHNAARFLPQLAADVRALSVPFAQTLFYDDGSDDDTAAVARSLGLPFLRGERNRGIAHARNRLAAAAACEWIHCHDADDPLSRDLVARLGPDCTAERDVVCCDSDWVKESDGSLLIAWRLDSEALARDPAAHLLARPLSLPQSFIRLERWRAVGGCDERLAMWEDADVHFRLALDGARFFHRAEVLVRSVRREESFSHDYPRNWGCRLQALEYYARDPRVARLRAAIGAEAERAAAALLEFDDTAGALRALALCRQLNYAVPSTRHPLLLLARMLVPPLRLLRWQQRWRRSRGLSSSSISQMP